MARFFTSLNMHLEWCKTIEEDSAYHELLESVVFREDFFDEAVFEASQTLYQREWVLLSEDPLHISVHGPKPFVDRVCESLVKNKPA